MAESHSEETAALREKLDRIAEIEMAAIKARLELLSASTARIETLLEPVHQGQLAMLSDNHKRLTDLEKAVQEIRVDMARAAFVGGLGGGGIVGAVTLGLYVLAKAQGWL